LSRAVLGEFSFTFFLRHCFQVGCASQVLSCALNVTCAARERLPSAARVARARWVTGVGQPATSASRCHRREWEARGKRCSTKSTSSTPQVECAGKLSHHEPSGREHLAGNRGRLSDFFNFFLLIGSKQRVGAEHKRQRASSTLLEHYAAC